MEHLTEAELQAWIDRELDPEERGSVRGHLEACADCRAGLRVLQAAAATFSAAMLRYDEDLAADPVGPARPAAVPDGVSAAGASRPVMLAVPRWAGRAAAVVLLLGAAAAAAMVPGSPFRDLFVESAPAPLPPVVEITPADPVTHAGASITVRPRDGRLTVRVSEFGPGTRVVVGLTERPEAVASLPDDAPDARFIIEAGAVELVGSGAAVGGDAGDAVDIRLPRSLQAGVVELDGDVIAQVRDGRLITLRQVSRTEAEAVFEVGG